MDGGGNIVVVDGGNNRVQVLTAVEQHIRTFGGVRGSVVGQFNFVSYICAGVAIDEDGGIVVADWGNSRLVIL